MPAGRPLQYKTAEELQAAIDAYFATCNADNPPLISGLAYHLEMTTHSLRNYEERDEFFTIVKRAKQKIEMSFEKNLLAGSCTGSIFWLKNHAGYRDKTEQELSGPDGGPVQIQEIKRTIVK